MNLGIALAMSQQFDWAIRAFSVAAELSPKNPLPHRWMAKLYNRVKNDQTSAREHMRIWAQLRKELAARKTAPVAAVG
jgi:Flp pilus assembly protein TadD